MRREETKKEIGPVDACEEIATNTAENCGPIIIQLYDEDRIRLVPRYGLRFS